MKGRCYAIFGQPVIVRFGKYIGITNERLDKANEMFTKYQIPVILFGKFIAGIRILIPYLAGINKMSYNTVSAVVWVSAFIIVGKYIEFEWRYYHRLLHQYMVPAILFVVLLVGIYFGLKIRHKHRNK
jgi:membrane protein DedA with SNARE-associated domain